MNLVIFGGTGDLAYRKLYPAIYNLTADKKTDGRLMVYAIGSKPLKEDEFCGRVAEAVSAHSRRAPDRDVLQSLYKRIKYIKGDALDPQTYMNLSELPDDRETIFFLAVQPGLFDAIVKGIRNTGLNRQNGKYKKVMVEKPLGSSLETARSINAVLSSAFPESSIFRIDHYLGKEMTANISALRFSNSIFEPLLCAKHVERIRVEILEQTGVAGRGRYYDKAGAIKDMLQNHMLQLLCLAVMEPPGVEGVTASKVQVLSALDTDKINELKIGQYKGYREEEGVGSDSLTETFISLKTHLKTERWKDVPLFLTTGKHMKDKYARVVYEFRDSPSQANKLIVKIQPEEGVELHVNLYKPGTDGEIAGVKLNYCQTCIDGLNTPEAYEKLIFEAMKGEKSSFTSWEEAERSWEFADAVSLAADKKRNSGLIIYAQGSAGMEFHI